MEAVLETGSLKSTNWLFRRWLDYVVVNRLGTEVSCKGVYKTTKSIEIGRTRC